ncbi:dynein regulatory complex subunit 7 isoform X1 [Corythoichthys intestinalis]|uniref:dynein regulatory complex subunit 7 isoform X1 n=1 Tax=Corythoichthys intestinalis TaxID=161448 RepID=UPI0025A4F67C|nr:dynein regulatory complex subunit 7 isoform X1 [Corythoichthys intestinalis]XP_057685311.1 dynein regulatory complex subunit 7 isoform X1 [Corythoichthys intestinalis]XP_057685313.1 dynein regulatory complex subunit 7 isoform X1 [Corythoichthys intestinalis]XP_057685314.1 dynein regulatory complex subunit 7 isoform X1 [Corythoichthys intestinalis]
MSSADEGTGTPVESSAEEQVGSGDEQLEEVSPVPALSGFLPSLPLPESYRQNSVEEVRVLAIADNFQCQYRLLCPERKPLLLCPINECGVQKFVSTTLRPTMTSHPELLNWDGCASFVADFLSLNPLEPPVELPRFLFSATSVLRSQTATCFEYATVLCSLLLGANYDAYCVSGYASKEMCQLDQRRQECPIQGAQAKESDMPAESEPWQRFQREPKSRFLTRQAKKKQEEAEAQAKQQEQEIPEAPADPLRGLRVHCWVLVLAGCRSVQENFLIDPLTGRSYSTTYEHFLGVESVWNNLNYYVNMQDCKNSCADLVYDLHDIKMWEPVLFGVTSKRQLSIEVLKRKEMKMMGMTFVEEEEERVFQMPRTWVTSIYISKEDLETRWPGGWKMIRYKKVELEMFAPYLRMDGLVTRLSTYKDLDCTELMTVKEWYQNRNDHLKEREVNKVTGITTERFTPGRHFHLLFHRYTSTPADGGEHEMEFSGARVDGLVRRWDTPEEMTESFKGREDFLYYRQVIFDCNVKLPEEHISTEPEERPLLKVLERFHRNPRKDANDDVAERVFVASQRRIDVKYHLEENRFVPCMRTFTKPLGPRDSEFRADMVTGFHVDPDQKPLKTLALYELLSDLVKAEQEVDLQIKSSKKEVRDIVACREQEEIDILLHFSPWTATGIAKAHSLREEMERVAAEEQRWLLEKDTDFLASFLIGLRDIEITSAEDAQRLYEDSLTNFNEQINAQTRLIQERHDQATKALQTIQEHYQETQQDMSHQETKEYQAYCAQHTFQIHIAEKRLSMHKRSAAQKYRALDQRLKQDPRLAPFLLN